MALVSDGLRSSHLFKRKLEFTVDHHMFKCQFESIEKTCCLTTQIKLSVLSALHVKRWSEIIFLRVSAL